MHSYDEHTAAKTYLDWNPQEPKQFVSGSNDCKIKIFSIDQPSSIMEFTRMHSNYDTEQGVECVKYNPHDTFQIASCQKNKRVSIWDTRKLNRPVLEFIAHTESAMCLDWHPTQKGILLSGG